VTTIEGLQTENNPFATERDLLCTQSDRGWILPAHRPTKTHSCHEEVAVTSTALQHDPTTTTSAQREDIVRSHLPLVGHLVREMLGRLPAHVSREDLVSAGMAALAGAAKSFDPSRGIPFGSFATARIRGALLDELRGLDWASRSVRSRARRVDTTQQELTAALGRTPTRPELAQALGIAVDELKTIADDVQRAVVLSLQGFTAGTAEDLVPERTAGPEDLILHREKIGYLHHAINALPDRLRHVVTAYFFNERPMNDIAQELGVTESRISQLRAEALVLLRDGLNNHLDPQLLTNPDHNGCIARRREAYYHQIAAQGNLNTRLAITNPLGMPHGA
jgi:RNA polymerase sigma factor for flagellar operon FliA